MDPWAEVLGEKTLGTCRARPPSCMGLPFKNSHARKREHVLAVDLGARTTKAVHLQRRGDKFTLANFALLDTPVHDKALSAETLADLLKEIEIGRAHV